MKKILKSSIISAINAILLFALMMTGCDNRNSVNRSKEQPSFTTDFTAIRDLATGRDFASITFSRDGRVFSEAEILINNAEVPSQGNGNYFAEDPTLNLVTGLNEVTFSVHDDDYLKTVTFEMPDSFAITAVNPRINSGASDVQIAWTRPAGAEMMILVVQAREYPFNNTLPLLLLLDAGVNNFVIPDTTFEDETGFVVDDIYYIHLVAFNESFGDFEGLDFLLPEGLPQRRVNDPLGFFRYGVIAKYDSIIVLP